MNSTQSSTSVRTKFPNLYRRRLIAADFFGEDNDSFKTDPPSRKKYDLVVGNVRGAKT